MNYLLGQLEELGYLVRLDDPDDMRSRRVTLTERGASLRRTIRRTVTTIERELEAELGRSSYSYSQLRHLLVRLNETALVGGKLSGFGMAPGPTPRPR